MVVKLVTTFRDSCSDSSVLVPVLSLPLQSVRSSLRSNVLVLVPRTLDVHSSANVW